MTQEAFLAGGGYFFFAGNITADGLTEPPYVPPVYLSVEHHPHLELSVDQATCMVYETDNATVPSDNNTITNGSMTGQGV